MMHIIDESLQKSLGFYCKKFGPKTKPMQQEIVDLGSQYEKFYESVRQIAFSRQNQIYLFFGLEGNGKKTVIDYCINKLSAESFKVLNIVIDARVFKTEKLFLEEFYRKLIKEDEVPENVVMYSKGQSFLFSEIDSVIKDIKPLIMITVENLCDLSKNSRQVLLYSLLDWIRTSNVHIVIVGLVKDLMFLDLLEKRVKSRLSFTSFNFFKYSFEELKEVIVRRIKGNPYHETLNNKLIAALNEKEIEEFLRYYYLGQRTVEWFINIFRLAFSLMTPSDLEEHETSTVLFKGLKAAIQMLEPEYQKEILSDLVASADLVLVVVLKRLIEQGRTPLNFMVILDEIKDLKRRTSNFSAINYADKTLLKAYENLHDMNFIRLEGSNEKGNKLENFDCVLNVNLEDLRDFLKENSGSIPSFLNEWAKS